jgi:hypothetical protein
LQSYEDAEEVVRGQIDTTKTSSRLHNTDKRSFTMQSLATTALLSLMSLALAIFSASAPAATPDSLLADTGWEAFVGPAALGSFAWAGEDETFSVTKAVVADAELNVQSLTGLAAPEPPALVLAGIAFGGVLCGRSLLARRRPGDDAQIDTCES